MPITPEEVRVTAHMARLGLSAEEIDRMAAELGRILDHVAELQAVDVAGIEPTTLAVPLACPLRADEPGSQLAQEEALRNAPSREDGLFAVPVILDKDAP